ncbi:MAG TPA: hypothetical protein VMP08_24670, partial [Anaerolineae bacterium]|nr:hypothetical protein [Anaerolineae bacterium]
ENDDSVELGGTGHYPPGAACNLPAYPYRNPLQPRADQSVIIRAKSYEQDLTDLTVWYTTNAGATAQDQWLSLSASVEVTVTNCNGQDPTDIWWATIPAQASRVWYKIAYTDGSDTQWQLSPGQGGGGVVDNDGGWTTASTTLTYAPPDVIAVDDDFNTGTTGWNYDHFTSVESGVSAVAAGGTVNVYSGNYADNIVINKPLTLTGWDVANTIVIHPAVSNPNCGGGGGGVLCAGGSNLILVQANNVTIHNLTLDGDNPTLTSGVIRNGADLDARNGIIEDNTSGPYGGLAVYDTTIRNIYLRGLSASSGGDNFNLHNNTVQNVHGDAANSVAIINEGGAGRIANNTVSQAADAIAARGSRGTYIQYNTVTASGKGVHSDNNGAGGGTYDVLEWNDVSSCTSGGHGVWVLAPQRDVSVHNNTVTGCTIGLAVAGQNASATPAFDYNTVDGQSLSGSTGIDVTTNQLGYGYSNVSASFDYNAIANTAIGINLEQAAGYQLTAAFTNHSLSNNTTGLEMAGGNVTFAGNNVDVGTTAVTQSGGTLLAYANNFTNYTTPFNHSGGTPNVAHNWWGTYVIQPSGVSTADWQGRLGSPLVQLGGYVVWATGSGSATLDGAALSGGTGTAVIINHGHTYPDAPFGNVSQNNMCSNYYDFFTVNGSGTWAVSVPVDSSPTECLTRTLEPGRLFWIPAGTDYATDCIVPNNNNSACWDLITTNVITGGQNITVTGLSVAALGGTQFVAGSATGTDPTAVTIIGLAATTDRSTAPAGLILVGVVIAAAGTVLVMRRRH